MNKEKNIMQKLNLPDWAIRAIKTFVQAFFGVLITAFVPYLANGFPPDWSTFWLWFSPVVAASLSAAISAAWNIILEHLEEK